MTSLRFHRKASNSSPIRVLTTPWVQIPPTPGRERGALPPATSTAHVAGCAGPASGSLAAQRQRLRGRDDEPDLGARFPAVAPGRDPRGPADGECEARGGREDPAGSGPAPLPSFTPSRAPPSFPPRGSEFPCFRRARLGLRLGALFSPGQFLTL